MESKKKEKSVSITTQQEKPKKDLLSKVAVYEEFILWSALPYEEQVKLGIETQGQFAAFYNVQESTLSNWKDRKDYKPRVRALRDKWAFGKTGKVIDGIYRAAVRGNPHSQRLWMQVFEGFSEKQEVTHVQKVEITPTDIRFIIEGLPENLKIKHYANLRELLDDASMVRSARDAEGSDWTDGPAPTVPIETYIDAQDVSREGTDVVAPRYTSSVCDYMVGKISPNNYKGAERWWEIEVVGNGRI